MFHYFGALTTYYDHHTHIWQTTAQKNGASENEIAPKTTEINRRVERQEDVDEA